MLTVGLSQVLFPVILLLGLNGLLVGVLQSYDQFTIPAISPAMWNIVIIVLLVVLRPHFQAAQNGEVYAYAIAILVATLVQLMLALAALGRIDFRLRLSIDWHDPRIRQVFMLMMPVTIGLGIVNLDQLINSDFGSLVSEQAPRAIDNAFRVYMLPQGMFSVAVATVLFPTLSRMAASRDSSRDAPCRRQRDAPDQPAADPGRGVHGRAALADRAAAVPTRRVQGANRRTSSRSPCSGSPSAFPSAGLNLLLTRTFFAVQRPWIPTAWPRMNIVVDIIVSVGLYKPLGIAGLVIGTVVGQRADDLASAAPAADRLRTAASRAHRR